MTAEVAATEQEEASDLQECQEPVPFAVGTYALYETPEGGIHLTFREKNGTEHHVEVPTWAVGLLREGDMSPVAILKALKNARRRK